MGMGTGACSGWVISYDDLKKICPKEVSLVESAVGFDNGILGEWNWGEVSRAVEFDELPDSIKNL